MELKRITEEEMNAQGVCAAPDILNGSPSQNKALFDRMVRNLVAPAVNACVDAIDAVNEQQVTWGQQENNRMNAENERVTAEVQRDYNEKLRQISEAGRVSAEQERGAAEAERRAAEKRRESAESGYVTQSKEAAEAAKKSQQAVENMRVSVKTLEPGSQASVEKSMVEGSVSLRIGIPRGDVGPTGPQGERGPQGETGPVGPAGKDGTNGLTPSIGPDGCWLIGTQHTGVSATGEDGRDGSTPWIGENGNWLIDGVDTGFPSRGPAGQDGKDGADGEDGQAGQDGYTPVKGTDYWTAEDKEELAQTAYEELVRRTEWQATKTALSGGDEVIPESDLNFTTSFIAVQNFTGSLMVGLKYIVQWDGAEYTCIGHSGDGGVYIGNGSLVGESESNNEPFCIQWYAGTNYVNVHKKTSTAEEITLKVTTDATFKYNELPSEYLPMAEIIDAVKDGLEPGGSSDDCVKTVNGKAPDENGNVVIETGGSSGGGLPSGGGPNQVLVTDAAGSACWADKPFGKEGTQVEVVLPECQPEYLGDDGFGITEGAPAFVVGDTYIISWNGAEYRCAAQDLSSMMPGAVALGNLTMFGMADTGEPFVIAAASGQTAAMPLDGSTTLTLAISHEKDIIKTIDPKYIKDMYYEGGGGTVLLPQQEIPAGSDTGSFELNGESAPALTVGEIYTVNWNGTEYTCEAVDSAVLGEPGYVVMGDIYSMSGGTVGTAPTGEPFVLMVAAKERIIAFAADGSTTLTLAIYSTGGVVHPIPAKYLPEGVPCVIEGEVKVLLEECQLSNMADGYGIAEGAPSLTPGQSYIVTYNGVDYTTRAVDMSSMSAGTVGFGNLGFNDSTFPNTGEPFLGVAGSGMMQLIPLDNSKEITLSIRQDSTVVKKLDNRCLDWNTINEKVEEKTIATLDETSPVLPGSAEGSIRARNAAGEDDSYTMGAHSFASGKDAKATAAYASAEGRGVVSHRAEQRVTGAFNAYDKNETGVYETVKSYRAYDSTTSTHTYAESYTFDPSARLYTLVNPVTATGLVPEGMYYYEYGTSSLSYINKRLSSTPDAGGLYPDEIRSCPGTYEETRGPYVHVVGCGTADHTRYNACTLSWEGVGWLKGGLKIGGTSQGDEAAIDVVKELNTKPGKVVAGVSFPAGDGSVVAGDGAEVFNDTENNVATGVCSTARGCGTVANRGYMTVEGAYNAYNAFEMAGYHEIVIDVYTGLNSAVTYYYAESYTYDGPTGRYTLIDPQTSVGSVPEGMYYMRQGFPEELYKVVKLNARVSSDGTNHLMEYHRVSAYSESRGPYAHVVGNGTADRIRSNAYTLSWDGVGWFAGGLKIGGTGQDDETAKTVATMDDIQTAIFGAMEASY